MKKQVKREVGHKGLYFRTVRAILKVFISGQNHMDRGIWQGPHILIGHHQNFRGPIRALVHLPDSVDFWVISHLFSPRETFAVYYNHTFRRLPRILALVPSLLAAGILPGLIKSSGAIPVYRSSAKILKTFKESIRRLEAGRQVMIFPDIDYRDGSEEVGQVYQGFTGLDRLYYSRTQEHLAFVPVHINMETGEIRNSQPLYMRVEKPGPEDRAAFLDQLTQALNSKQKTVDS